MPELNFIVLLYAKDKGKVYTLHNFICDAP